MMAEGIKRRMKAYCAAIALAAVVASLAWLDMPQASAQAIMRTPNLNIQPRIPTINPTIAPRLDTNVAARPNMGTTNFTPPNTRLRVNPNSTMPYLRNSPYLYPACEAADRECQGTALASGDG